MHPGWVDTPALSRAMPTFKRITNAILRTPSQGADTIVWLALTALRNWSSESRFYFDRRPSPAHLNKRTAQGGDAPTYYVHTSNSFYELLGFFIGPGMKALVVRT